MEQGFYAATLEAHTHTTLTDSSEGLVSCFGVGEL